MRLLLILVAMALSSAALAKAAPPAFAECAACHGAAGLGSKAWGNKALGNKAAGYPSLAGQSSRYLFWQLMDFKRGTRKNPVMQPIARTLSKVSMTAIAHYYASLPVPVTREPATLPGGLGKTLAVHGIWHQSAISAPACDFCHGVNGTGSGPFPRLAGQPASYLAAQLKAWQSGARPAGLLGLMGRVARPLSARQIQAVASYYAALSPHPPLPK